MQITLDHPFCVRKRQMEKICKPLFTRFPFDYVDYERYYFDGDYITIGLSTEFFCATFNNHLLPDLQELQANTSHCILLSPVMPLPEVLQDSKWDKNIALAKEFKIPHRLYLIFNSPSYVEVFGFGFNRTTKNIIETFMNYLPVLEKFCTYFSVVGQELIEQADQTKLKFDHAVEPELFKDIDFINSYSYLDFLKEANIKKYQLQGKHGKCLLSKREFECLLWSAKDKSAKQIGKILSLSPRTVEDYLVSLKNKLNCESKLELADVAAKNPLIKAFLG